VLSGFLMMRSHIFKGYPKLDTTFRFAWNKIRALYPLHILTMLMAAVYTVYMGRGIVATLRDMIIHAGLLQMWIPHPEYYSTLNVPSWYLCTLFFIYLCFPLISNILKPCSSTRTFTVLTILLVGQFCISCGAHLWGTQDDYAWFNVKWFVYFSPITRWIDFAVGCALGKLSLSECTKSKRLNSVADMLLCAAIAVSFVIYATEYGFLGAKAFRFTFLFIPSTVILIWQTTKKESLLSRLLSFPALVKIGDLSPYTFLIHGVAIKYTGLFLLAFFCIENVVVTSLVSFGASILAAVIWKKFCSLLTVRQTATIR
jgi:peptidoglycan/LPS O-acetylase OafA/YrhL